mmetsp:Transcript_7030/g.16044  ORF Transcript_7030/g.16044 Transcript_7030/m.16044 type:complete len:227 (+) Transcript_7030:1019-1699(+)
MSARRRRSRWLAQKVSHRICCRSSRRRICQRCLAAATIALLASYHGSGLWTTSGRGLVAKLVASWRRRRTKKTEACITMQNREERRRGGPRRRRRRRRRRRGRRKCRRRRLRRRRCQHHQRHQRRRRWDTSSCRFPSRRRHSHPPRDGHHIKEAFWIASRSWKHASSSLREHSSTAQDCFLTSRRTLGRRVLRYWHRLEGKRCTEVLPQQLLASRHAAVARCSSGE